MSGGNCAGLSFFNVRRQSLLISVFYQKPSSLSFDGLGVKVAPVVKGVKKW